MCRDALENWMIGTVGLTIGPTEGYQQRQSVFTAEFAPGDHVVLDSEEVVTVRSDRLDGTSNRISL
jgi:hypothetical protein